MKQSPNQSNTEIRHFRRTVNLRSLRFGGSLLMAITVALVIVLGGVAFGVSLLANKKPDTHRPRFVLPYQLDRSDFDGTNLEWLLVLFSSQTCDSCITVLNRINKLAMKNLHVQNVEFPSESICTRNTVSDLFPVYFLLAQKELLSGHLLASSYRCIRSALGNFKIVPPETEYACIS